jgi:hypothetical protein
MSLSALAGGQDWSAANRSSITRLVERLRHAGQPCGHDLRGLKSGFDARRTRVLITEATNRDRLLALGRLTPRAKGSALDPARLSDDRLEHLIQAHRDPGVVEALRAKQRRRQLAAGPG